MLDWPEVTGDGGNDRARKSQSPRIADRMGNLNFQMNLR